MAIMMIGIGLPVDDSVIMLVMIKAETIPAILAVTIMDKLIPPLSMVIMIAKERIPSSGN
jgi:hypothetical protein